MSGSTALVLSNRSYPTPTVSSNFAKNLFDWETLSSVSSMPSGGSVSRAGNAMLYDSTGKLTYAPNNLLLWSQDFQTTAEAGSSRPWVIGNGTSTLTTNAGAAPDNTNTASLMAFSASAYPARYQQINAVGGVTYIFSVWMKLVSGSGANARVEFYSPGGFMPGAATNTTIDGSWKRIAVSATATGSGAIQVFIDPNYVASATGSVLIWGAQLEAVTYQTTPSTYNATTTAAYYGPRFDYDPVTLAAKGLLVEVARTNLQPYSQSFSSWTTSGGRLNSLTAQTSLDGTSNAVFVPEDSTTGFHQLYYGSYSRGSTSALTYTCTVYAKAAVSTQRRLFLAVYNGPQTSGAEVIFDLINGQVGVAASIFGSYIAPTATITSVGNSWYRCSLTFTSDTNGSFFVYLGLDANTGTQAVNRNYAGNGTSGVTVFGVQVEQANFASSYIPTVASSVARAAETFSLTGYANRLLEAYYIDQETGVSSSLPETVVSSGAVTINPPTFGWVTSLRAYTNAYAGDIASPSWLSFSRTGNAMYYDSTGTLTWAPANLLSYSQAFNDSYWSKVGATITADTSDTLAPDGTQTADRINGTSGGFTQYVLQQSPTNTLSTQAGNTYTYSVYLKAGTISSVRLYIFNTATGVENIYGDFNLSAITVTAGGSSGTTRTASIVDVGNGWRRCSVSGGLNTSAAQVVNVVLYADNGNYYAWGIQAERTTYQTTPRAYIPTTSAAVYGPRYDYDASTVPATPRGLLIEESRANLCTQSNAFSTSAPWITGTYTVTSGISDPAGGTAGWTWTRTTTGASYIYRQDAVSATTSYTFSVYVKRGTGNYAALAIQTSYPNQIRVIFNLATGVISTAANAPGAMTNPAASITPVGNGWYRISVSGTTDSGTTLSSFISFSSNGVYIDGTDTVANTSGYLYGAQLEAGSFATSFATSYIPTTTASVTRAADVAQLTGSALTTAGAATGTAIIETGAFQGAAVQASILASNQSNRRIIYNANSTTSGSYDGTNILSTTISNVTTTTLRQALGWGATTGSIVINNGTLVSGALSLGTNATVYLGATLGGTNQPNTWFRSMALYNQRLPDTILRQKSTVGAPY